MSDARQIAQATVAHQTCAYRFRTGAGQGQQLGYMLQQVVPVFLLRPNFSRPSKSAGCIAAARTHVLWGLYSSCAQARPLAPDDMQASLSSFFKKKETTTTPVNGTASDDDAAHSAATTTTAAAPKRKLPASLQSPPNPAATAPTDSAPVAVAPAIAAPAAAAPPAPAAPATKPKDLDPVQPAPTAAEPAAVWMWQSGPSWTPYDPEQSALLERAWTANEPRAPLDNTRHVDFHTMRQARWSPCLTHATRGGRAHAHARTHARGSLAACRHR